MAKPQVSFAKRQREQAKRDRQQMKMERRAQRNSEAGQSSGEGDMGEVVREGEIPAGMEDTTTSGQPVN